MAAGDWTTEEKGTKETLYLITSRKKLTGDDRMLGKATERAADLELVTANAPALLLGGELGINPDLFSRMKLPLAREVHRLKLTSLQDPLRELDLWLARTQYTDESHQLIFSIFRLERLGEGEGAPGWQVTWLDDWTWQKHYRDWNKRRTAVVWKTYSHPSWRPKSEAYKTGYPSYQVRAGVMQFVQAEDAKLWGNLTISNQKQLQEEAEARERKALTRQYKWDQYRLRLDRYNQTKRDLQELKLKLKLAEVGADMGYPDALVELAVLKLQLDEFKLPTKPSPPHEETSHYNAYNTNQAVWNTRNRYGRRRDQPKTKVVGGW